MTMSPLCPQWRSDAKCIHLSRLENFGEGRESNFYGSVRYGCPSHYSTGPVEGNSIQIWDVGFGQL